MDRRESLRKTQAWLVIALVIIGILVVHDISQMAQLKYWRAIAEKIVK